MNKKTQNFHHDFANLKPINLYNSGSFILNITVGTFQKVRVLKNSVRNMAGRKNKKDYIVLFEWFFGFLS